MNIALHQLELGAEHIPLRFTRNLKARRYILRFHDGIARVTIPRGGTVQYAQEFARKNRDWIQKQIERTPSKWEDGTLISFRGHQIPLHVMSNGPELQLSFGDQQLSISVNDDVRLAVEARMRTIATKELPQRIREMAAQLGIEFAAVAVRNQRSRWGSCSRTRRISLNWRLIQTPEFVRDYIIVHELMHLREMNHSARFWGQVEQAFPGWREAEKWLRRNSALLR